MLNNSLNRILPYGSHNYYILQKDCMKQTVESYTLSATAQDVKCVQTRKEIELTINSVITCIIQHVTPTIIR